MVTNSIFRLRKSFAASSAAFRVAVVIFVAGGQSSRMGTSKAWLEFAGRPLLEHLVERMLAVFPEAVVVTAPGQDVPRTAARVVYDERPGEGPVAGIVVGLREAPHPLAFGSSCDALNFGSPSITRCSHVT